MLLTIDVGNTNTVLGLFDGPDVVEHWRVSTDPERTADELAVLLQGLLRQSTLFAEPDVSGIALCSTVPPVPRRRACGDRRARGEDRCAAAVRQPEGGRQRPHHERRGGRASLRRAR